MGSNLKNQSKVIMTNDGAMVPSMMKVNSSVSNEGKYGATVPKMQTVPSESPVSVQQSKQSKSSSTSTLDK